MNKQIKNKIIISCTFLLEDTKSQFIVSVVYLLLCATATEMFDLSQVSDKVVKVIC